jgi:hypothetical protein
VGSAAGGLGLSERLNDGSDEAGDVMGRSFGRGFPAEFAERAGGDRPDGNRFYTGKRKRDSSGTGNLSKMAGAGRTAECGGIDAGSQRGAQLPRRRGGDYVALGIDNVDVGSGIAEGVGNNVAGDGGTGQQYALALDPAAEGGNHAFGHVALGRELDVKTGLMGGFCGGLPDGCDMRAKATEGDLEGGGALDDDTHCVGAGEDHPVVAEEIAQGIIERIVAWRRLDFEYGHFSRFCAGGAESLAEPARLVRGTGNENAFLCERLGDHEICFRD